MSDRNTVVRSLHDLGLGIWFGGSLMGAVGVNGSAAEAKDPIERLRLSSLGWAKWVPWQVAGIAAHTIGGVGLIIANRRRVRYQPGAKSATWAKFLVTAAAAGTTAYSGVLGAKIYQHRDEAASGATEPDDRSSRELAKAQQQLQLLQWATPVLTGVATVLSSVQGEQQVGTAGLLDLGLGGTAREMLHATGISVGRAAHDGIRRAQHALS